MGGTRRCCRRQHILKEADRWNACMLRVLIREEIASDMRAENYDMRTYVISLHDDTGGTTGDTRCYYLGRHPLKRAARWNVCMLPCIGAKIASDTSTKIMA